MSKEAIEQAKQALGRAYLGGRGDDIASRLLEVAQSYEDDGQLYKALTRVNDAETQFSIMHNYWMQARCYEWAGRLSERLGESDVALWNRDMAKKYRKKAEEGSSLLKT